LVGAGLFAFLQLANSGKITKGLRLAGLQIGGQSLVQAKEILKEQIIQFNERKIAFIFNEKKWQFSPEELGLIFDLETTFNQISLYGRQPNIFAGSKDQLAALFFRKNLSIAVKLEEKKFNQTLAVLTILDEPAQNAKLTYSQTKKDFLLVPEKSGLVVDRARLKEELLKNAGQLIIPTINLILTTQEPSVNIQNLSAVKEQAEQIIAQAPITIKTEVSEWLVQKQELAAWMATLPSQAVLTLAESEVKNFLTQIAPTINQEPVNAKLSFKNNQIKVLVPAQNGQKLDIEKNYQIITQAVLAGQTSIELEIKIIEPEITSQKINDLGLTSRLGEGKSNFAGSPSNRQQNITLATSMLNGLLIAPSQEFSFGDSVGPIDERGGWLPELVIKNKQTVPDYGGGICQVSTTLFRAAVNSGLKITERFPHAYPVIYYDPQGFDATVYPPSPDLKFINDTPGYILLQGRIEDAILYFEIYGTNDGREIKILGPTILESNPDGSMKTVLTQEIWRDGELERQNTFWSNYKSPSLYPKPSPTPKPSPSPSPEPTESPPPSATPQPSASPTPLSSPAATP